MTSRAKAAAFIARYFHDGRTQWQMYYSWLLFNGYEAVEVRAAAQQFCVLGNGKL